MIFNGIDFNDYLVVERIRRKLLPPINVVSINVPGDLGARFPTVQVESNIIEVDVRIIEKDREAVQAKAREVAGLLFTREPKKLKLKDEPDKFNMAILQGDIDLEKFMNTGYAVLEFLCLDPLAYSDNISSFQNINNKDIINNGTAPVFGKITIKIVNESPNVKITLQNTGEYIFLEGPFVTNDILHIDLEKEVVTKNGISIPASLDSDFFKIPPGTFRLTTTYGTIDLEFREAWL